MQATPLFHRYSKATAAICLASLLAGCSTFSFAPPPVEVDRDIANPDPSKCAQLAGMDQPALQPNVVGAIELTDNFVRAYRCASHEAADGRQIFEVPSMLALVTAAIGPSFGLDDDGRIAAAASAALYGRANSYFAPKEKAKLLDTALDAVLCVKTESVKVSFFDTTRKPDSGTPALTIRRTVANGGKAEIDVPRQYFEMVSAALFSVERILAQRLRDAGAMDTAGIASQFADFAKQAEEAKAKKARLLNIDNNGDGMLTFADRTPEVNSQMIELDIEELQPRLQTCIVRAKL